MSLEMPNCSKKLGNVPQNTIAFSGMPGCSHVLLNVTVFLRDLIFRGKAFYPGIPLCSQEWPSVPYIYCHSVL